MISRLLSAAAALWTAGYLVVYLAVVRSQEGSPAWWYVGLVVVAVVAWALAAWRSAEPGWLLVGLVIAAGSMLAGLLSVGLLLVPAFGAGIAALALRRPARPGPGHSVRAAAGAERR